MNFFVFTVKLFIFAYLINIDDFSTASINIYNSNNETVEIIDSVSAAFGPHISDNGFQGYIVIASPIGGCTQLAKPPNANISNIDPDQWIVLIKRTPTIYGNCSFDLKVHNAQKAGYKAVIIYNSESDNLIKMSSSGKYNIRIPSVFISLSDGLDIAKFYTYKNHTYVVINNDDDNLNYLLIPFICVVAVCFFVAISIFVSKFAFHVYKLRKNRFPKSALKKIPTRKYQKTDKYDTCPICLNEYEEGEKMRILPCEHAYHVECIDKWLLRNNRFCPVCKRRVLPGGSDSESDDGGHENNHHTNSSQVNGNVPNEDDDTNESSRLLVNVRNNSNDDNISANTINTLLNSVTTTNELINQTHTLPNNNPNNASNDLSSMNNQMTTSLSSSQAPNNINQNKDSRSCSSRYGSIASSLNAATTSKSAEQGIQISDNEIETNTKKIIVKSNNIEQIDSKATPEFYSPVDSSFITQTTIPEPKPYIDQIDTIVITPETEIPHVNTIKKKNSKNKKNKVSSSNSNQGLETNSQTELVRNYNPVFDNDSEEKETSTAEGEVEIKTKNKNKSKGSKKKKLSINKKNYNQNAPSKSGRNNDDDELNDDYDDDVDNDNNIA